MALAGMLKRFGARGQLTIAKQLNFLGPVNVAGDFVVGDEQSPRALPSLESPVFDIGRRFKTTVFTGRDRELEAIRAELGASGRQAIVPSVSVTGLGGVGKTQLALEYAVRHRDEYALVCLISAQSLAALQAGFARLCTTLGVPFQPRDPLEDLAPLAYAALDRVASWLLIFDNADDPALLFPYLPRSGAGHLLTTSRNPAWTGIAAPIAIDVLDADAAVELLERVTQCDDRAGAEELATALGCYPLALVQAAAHIALHHRTFARYLRRLREVGPELFDRASPPDYEHTVLTVWHLSMERLGDATPAVDLLRVCAFLAPDPIPREIFDSLLIEPRHLDDAFDRLAEHSLVHFAEDHLVAHRVLQSVIRHDLSTEQRQTYAQVAFWLVAGALPEGSPKDPATWALFERLTTHGEAVVERTEGVVSDSNRAGLLSKLAASLYLRGLPVEAIRLTKGMLAILGRDPEEHARELVIAYENHATVLLHGRRLQAGEVAIEQALALAREDPDIGPVALGQLLNTRGLLHWEQGRYEEAERDHREALRLYGAAEDAPPDAIEAARHNRGRALARLGATDEALSLLEESVELTRARGQHVALAETLGLVSQTYLGRGDATAARHAAREAVDLLTAHLPSRDHPSVAEALAALSDTAVVLGDYDAAISALDEALAIDRAVHGPSHVEVATDLAKLAEALLGRDGWRKAAPTADLAVRIVDEQPDAPSHRKALVYRVKAQIEQKAGRNANARRWIERAIALGGGSDTDLLVCLTVKATTYAGGKDLDGLLATCRSALAVADRIGPSVQGYKDFHRAQLRAHNAQ
jgi:tetratricopeptide (TPR) repeat protein